MNDLGIIEKLPVQIIKAPIPMKTESYQPVPHVSFVKYITKRLDEYGFNVSTARFQADAKGGKLVGTLTLEKDTDWIKPTVVIRNSYDKSMSLGIGSGASTVWVCLNGQMSADVVSLRKHTTNIVSDMGEIVNSQLDSLEANFEKNVEALSTLKEIQISKSTMYELIGELFVEQRVLTTTQINIVRKELYESENFQMLGFGGEMSAYNLYQNFTESLKISHPANYVRDHVSVHNLMMELA
jgi:hypothetical protein